MKKLLSLLPWLVIASVQAQIIPPQVLTVPPPSCTAVITCTQGSVTTAPYTIPATLPPVVTPPAVTPSANGTVILAGSGNVITDAAGNTWGISTAKQVTVNSVADTGTNGVTQLIYENGVVWQQITSGLWWGKTSATAAWLPSAGTSTSPLATTLPCPIAPASTSSSIACPSGFTGSWTQTTTYASAAVPTCWTPVLSPTSAPAGACTAVTTPPPVTPPPTGSGTPINLQLLLQGQTTQGQAQFNNPTAAGVNSQSIGFYDTSGGTASRINIYRAIIPVGQQADGSQSYTLYDTTTPAKAAAAYASYVTNSTWSTGNSGDVPANHIQISTPGAANAVNGAYVDSAATNCVNGSAGSGDLYAATGYSYKVSAVVNGVESALSPADYAVYVANGLRIAAQDVFNNAPVWNATNGGTTPDGSTMTLEMNVPYFNPFAGAGVVDSDFNIRSFNYIEMDVKTSVAGMVLTAGPENEGDIVINLPGGNGLNFASYCTFIPNQYVHCKLPLSSVMTDTSRGRQNAWYKWTLGQGNGASGTAWISGWKFTN